MRLNIALGILFCVTAIEISLFLYNESYCKGEIKNVACSRNNVINHFVQTTPLNLVYC